jgi:CHAT domain-containing protein/tetratricopeptide (TPR) repeat protein
VRPVLPPIRVAVDLFRRSSVWSATTFAAAAALVLWLPPTGRWTDPGDAWNLLRGAQHAVETSTDARFEQEWQGVAARNPGSPRALLAIAALAQQRYEYARADSFYERVIRVEPVVSEYAAAAHLGMGMWRAIGSDVLRADTLLSQARAQSLAAGDWHIAFQALVSLGKLRSRRAGPKVGLEFLRDARSVARRLSPDESAQLLCTEGTLMEQLADTMGRVRLTEGIRVARTGGARRELGVCDLALAQAAERVGYFEGAANAASEAVHIFEQLHFLVGLAAASQWLGYTRVERGYFAEGQRDLERAVRSAATAHYPNAEAWARTDLAGLELALGDADAAREQAERAAVLHESYGDLWGLAVDLEFQGTLAESRQELDEACAKYGASVEVYGRAGLTFNAVSALRRLALVYMRAARLDSAQLALDEATRRARASANVGWEVELPVHLARLAMLRGDLRAADSLVAIARPRYTWRNGDSTLLRSLPFAVLEAQLAFRTHRVATADSAIAFISSAVERRRRGMTDRDLRAGIAQLRGDWGGLSDSYPELIAGLAAAGRLSSAFRFVESIRAREIADGALRTIARMNDSSAAIERFRRISALPQPVALEDEQRRLSSDEALAVLTLGIAGAPTTAILVTRDTALAITLPPRQIGAPLIERYLRVVTAGTEPVAIGRQLGAALLDPIAHALPPQITHLEISPDGELYRVPFEALRLADDRFAVERFSISLVPSATVGTMLRALPTVLGATGLLAVGDPAFTRGRTPNSSDATTGHAPRLTGISLARLPHSAQEARRVAQYGVHSVVLTRDGANEAALRAQNWPSIGVAHFATHALIDAEGQARTALALTPTGVDDGFLTTSEIASLPLNGALVVLSACQSLDGQILGGEGLRGLTGPLFEAGARAIVVTHWSIGDRSVVPFVDRFYAAMARGQSVGDALRETKLAAIRDHAAIADWGAFTVIGDASLHPPLRPRRLSPLDWLHDMIQPARDTSVNSELDVRPRALNR